MGAIGPEPKNKKSLLDEWETIDHLSNCNIVRNIHNSLIGEMRKFKLDPIYDPHHELKIYNERVDQSVPIVLCYGAEMIEKVSRKKTKNKDFGLCASNNNLLIITERMPYTLRQMPQLSFPEAIYTLKESLKGYQYLYPKTGPAHVSNNKIGVNNKGRVKVWINDDFSQNHPNDEINSLLSTRSEKLDRQYNLISPQFRDERQMLENIIDVVEEKCMNGQYPPEFGNLLRQNAFSFKAARFFIESYVKEKQISLPDHLQLNKVEKQSVFPNQVPNQISSVPNQISSVPQQMPNKMLNSGPPQIIPYQQQKSPIVHFDIDRTYKNTTYNGYQTSTNLAVNPSNFQTGRPPSNGNIRAEQTGAGRSKPIVKFGGKIL